MDAVTLSTPVAAAAEATGPQTGLLGLLLVVMLTICASLLKYVVALLEELVALAARILRFLALAAAAGVMVFGILFFLVVDVLSG